ncbi:MAG TPA: undecaprenyl-diphosphate phosphatase [Candidatus Pelethocola excrementipullorum]|nr:undecaprenyl-diphosphate phosphatase [Candidatus Pelethocola excrementipullorum]
MSVWQAILLGLVQGITEFLPVSSSGHLVFLKQVMGLNMENDVLFQVLLHVGTLFPVIFIFRSDIKRLVWELIHIVQDIIDNIKIWIQNRRSQDEKRYHKLLSTNYRRFAVLILITTVPTGIIGYLIQGLVTEASGNLLAPAIGFFITAILLLVTECAANETEKSPRDTKYSEAAIIGVFQGLSVFPGISRSGSTLSACFLCGFSRKYAIKYSYIISIPAIVGAMIVELKGAKFSAAPADVALCLLSMVVAGIVGYFSIRFALSILRQKKLRYFSAYCIVIGIVAVIIHFAR